jgi:XTP/dITP diphosphohydrolase
MEVILASKNKGKIREIQEILHPYNITVHGMEDVGFDDEIIESGTTLAENAYIKAKAIHDKTGQAVLADDSGLFVNALQGAPGVFSARYAGVHKNDIENYTLLLKNMEKVKDRSAYFSACICYLNSDGMDKYFTGNVYGKIILEPIGYNGFGYDPIFMPNGFDQTFAELSSDIKNIISHRARAVEALMTFFSKQEKY